jgi:hypothetical protein
LKAKAYALVFLFHDVKYIAMVRSVPYNKAVFGTGTAKGININKRGSTNETRNLYGWYRRL